MDARNVKLICLALIGMSAMSCDSRDRSPPADSAVHVGQPVAIAPTTSRSGVAPAGVAPDPCPHTGQWAACSVERRLRQSGFVVRPLKDEAKKRPGFSVLPLVYSLGKTRLEVFLYPDEAALARDVAGLDTTLASPRGSPPAWEGEPIFVRSGNLAAVILSRSPRQAERAVLALTAGAPQPGSPR